ncbi:MAG: hypothetical protein KDA92_25060 [Planctomycetales bacterium]|nr:hypothetical protein [Planctomycetales bacterium]
MTSKLRLGVQLLTLGSTIAGITAPAHAELILAYDSSNSATGAVASEWWPGVVTMPLVRGEGLSPGTGGTFNSSGWTEEPTDYLEWGWSSSQPINLSDLDLRYDRSSSGPAVVDIQLSVNGGAFQSIFHDSDVNVSGEDNFDIDLSAFTSVSSAAFRLFGTGASSGAGTFDIEPLSGVSPARGIVVNGSVAAVPEPSSFVLASLAIGCLGLHQLRRRKTA